MNYADNSSQFDLFDDLVDSFGVDRELALKFFLVFAWFENVFKYLEYWEDRGYVKIDWMRFGSELNDSFDPERSPELKEAYDFLMEESPRNQRPRDHEIIWVDIEPSADATPLEKVLFHVNTVRNNFFHGGKFPQFRRRDAKLLEACLVILKECVEIHPSLPGYYREQLERVGD
jgi:hypothetical protein